jgi:flagellar protein FlgJ
MNVSLSRPTAVPPAWVQPTAPAPPSPNDGENEELREAFQSFVGQTLFGQMLRAMRKTVGKPAYFHGGRAEEIFQGQLDQVLAEKIADRSGAKLSDPMMELFATSRR